MNVQIVELEERTRVAGFWLLPGSRVEFNTVGEANTFVYRNGGKYTPQKPPKPKAKRKPKRDDSADDQPNEPAGTTAGDSSAG